ncbi:hypothetical protein SEA_PHRAPPUCCINO_31 [Mycobacterium phage Phrappuccino]|uniref:Uncharacterized protein n=1 Tax=Mycobacterium phage Phrappuccino TaxID=2591223 RepID=A0A514DDM3_9CAUD|nr:hypothetical protein KHQ87_gp031 [Mycobacterium phage Phrappuccino]QDH91709.1 hypothetical protein SEA_PHRAPPUCCINO_31 [Mycobacterium phage Phrappuccino]QIQ63153.1 hypothetical protein SEA_SETTECANDELA_31 [Mycobacterium phage Settecandela]
MAAIINGKAVVTAAELPMLHELAQVQELNPWEAGVQRLTGIPVLLAEEFPAQLDCGDNWFATVIDGEIHAWNTDELKAAMERVQQESRQRPLSLDVPSSGLFQQRTAAWEWAYQPHTLSGLFSRNRRP